MGAMLKLDAVNRILRGGGENPVNTLESTAGDALLAESMLDEVNYEVQMVGLVCNSEVTEFDPDENGHINIANTILHLDVIDGDNPSDLIIPRGNSPTRLYNVTQQTFVFTGALTARVVYGLDFEDLPYGFQMYITDETARRYQMVTVGDGAMDAILREVWLQSRARGRAADIRSRQLNLFGNMKSRLPYEAAKQTQRRSWQGWGARRV
jgi:hypothetical protein